MLFEKMVRALASIQTYFKIELTGSWANSTNG